uniref:Uncharacterized protein n=1 Tax=Moniliophthora roreri TaxID=221103 RepID=A0A0W0GDG6_MONRR
MSISMLGSASPLAARDPQTCHPNFEGAGIAIIGANGPVTGNGVVGSYKPDWHIQQNGQPHPSYIFKDINNNNIALTLDNGVLLLETASNSGGDPRQLFDINCGTCIPGASTIDKGSANTATALLLDSFSRLSDLAIPAYLVKSSSSSPARKVLGYGTASTLNCRASCQPTKNLSGVAQAPLCSSELWVSHTELMTPERDFDFSYFQLSDGLSVLNPPEELLADWAAHPAQGEASEGNA